MAVADTIALLFTDRFGKIGNLQFDIISRESHLLENDVTEHPVEPSVGASTADTLKKPTSISDNIRRRPDQITLDVVTSNTTMGILGIGAVTNLVSFFNSENRGNLLNAGPALKAYDDLCLLRDSGTLVDVVSFWNIYRNMAITSISITNDANQGVALYATVSLKEVRLVKATLVALPQVTRGASKVSKGAQPAKPLPAEAPMPPIGSSFNEMFGWLTGAP